MCPIKFCIILGFCTATLLYFFLMFRSVPSSWVKCSIPHREFDSLSIIAPRCSETCGNIHQLAWRSTATEWRMNCKIPQAKNSQCALLSSKTFTEFSVNNLENSHRQTEIFPSDVICPQTQYIKSDAKFVRRCLLVAALT